MAANLEQHVISGAVSPAKAKGRQSAMAVPAGGFFPDNVEQGRFGKALGVGDPHAHPQAGAEEGAGLAGVQVGECI